MHYNSKENAFPVPMGSAAAKRRIKTVAGGLLSVKVGKGRFFARPVSDDMIPVTIIDKKTAETLQTMPLPMGAELVKVPRGAIKRWGFKGAKELMGLLLSQPVQVAA